MNHLARVITEDEYAGLIELLNTGGKTFKPNPGITMVLILMKSTGIKLSEALAITSESIKENPDETLYISAGKNKYSLSAKMNGDLLKYCMKNKIGIDEKIFPFSARNLQQILSKAAKEVNLKDVSAESFRKMFAVSLHEKTNSVAQVAKALNVSNQTASRYLDL